MDAPIVEDKCFDLWINDKRLNFLHFYTRKKENEVMQVENENLLYLRLQFKTL